jgi:hypothetical protein
METVAQIEYYWPGCVPEAAIRPYEDTRVESYTLRAGVQIDPPGRTLGDVYDWMFDNDLRVARVEKLHSPQPRGRSRWQARYRLFFGPN